MIFNVDSKIKDRAMKQARKDGVPFSTILKLATKAYAEGKLRLSISDVPSFNETSSKEIKQALEDIKKEKNLSPSFTNAGDAIAYLNKQRHENYFS